MKCTLKRAVVIASVVLVAVGGALLVWPASAWVPSPIPGLEMKCFNETKPLPWSFCINKVSGSESRDLVYYFHGRDGAATWWNDETYYSGEVQRFWEANGIAAPTVVSVTFGPLWILTAAERGLLPVFTDHVIPRVEAELGVNIRRRMAVGESMGGINALVVGLKMSAIFSKVAALCPPLPTVSPESSLASKLSYVARTTTSWRHAAMMMWFSRTFYPTDAAWFDNNPVPLSGNFAGSSEVEFYLSCGVNDEWGCQAGAEAIVKNLQRRGGRVEWHLMPGGHCDIDSRSLALFLGD